MNHAANANAHAPYLMLHTQPRLSLATDQLLLSPEQAPALADALALADVMAHLHAAEQQRVQTAADAASADGYADGLAQGMTQGRQLAAAELAATVQQLHSQAQTQAAAMQQQAVTLALLVLRRVVAELAPEDVLVALARKAVEHLASASTTDIKWNACQLRVNPALLPGVTAQLRGMNNPDNPSPDNPEASLRLVADDSLAALDCVLETPAGRVLAGLEIQLARVQETLARTAHTPIGATA